EDVQSAEHRVTSGAAYQARLAELDGAPDRAAQLPKIRQQLLDGDSAYQRAIVNLQTARHEYSRLRSAVVVTDPQFKSASESLKEAYQAETLEKQEGTSGGLQRLPAAHELHSALRAADNARAAIQRGQTMLNALGAGNRSGSGRNSQSSSSGK